MPGTPAVELRHVSLAFERPVLRDVALTVATGETVAVLGESGTGKSTLLKLVLGLLDPDAGEVRVHGDVVNTMKQADRLALRRGIGMVFQGAALFDSLTVHENVAFALREHLRLAEDEIATRVHEALRLVDLDPAQVADQLPAQLSGGMRKRVGVARAIAHRPALLLYDEPTAGLDPLTTETVVALIARLQRELRVTSLVVSHDVRAMLRLADRLALLHDGTFAFVGDAESMRASDEAYTRTFLAAA
ncbi:MAG: ATP-binding cassette domain-containing protein [Gemmatimonadaceae bacterium]|jgi:phospholipid/cholesterol/gamma-HCH transport system ATP-binding protein|nr:ATP-binding cassette domain-containing protein [Gemmatimonadaceae bacterium]